MDDARTYPHGVPCWVDVVCEDPDPAATFYGGLFGWSFTDVVPPDAPGHYLIATQEGHDVAALASPDVEGAPATWRTTSR